MVKRVIIGFGILNLLAFLLVFKNGQAGIVKNNKTILNYEYEDISYNAYNNMFVIVRLFVVIPLISMVSHQQL